MKNINLIKYSYFETPYLQMYLFALLLGMETSFQLKPF